MMPGLLLGGDYSGDMKLTPLPVYCAGNPWALKNIPNSSLPIIWMSNKKAWVTLTVFDDWFFSSLYPQSQAILQRE